MKPYPHYETFRRSDPHERKTVRVAPLTSERLGFITEKPLW